MFVKDSRRTTIYLVLIAMFTGLLLFVKIWQYNMTRNIYTTAEVNQMEAYHLAYSTANAMADYLIVLADNANLVLQGNAQINGLIYGPNASVQLQSIQSTIVGAIIANNLDLQNGNINFAQIDYGIAVPNIAGFRRSVSRFSYCTN
jgi:hypothetical protein